MTNITSEDAIEQIKILKAFTGYDKDSPIIIKLHEALDMAIKALEQQPTDAKETIIKSALKYLVKMQIEEGSVGFAVDNDYDNECCWDDVLAWLEAQPCEDAISRTEAIDKLTKFYNMVLDDNGTKLNIRDIVGALERLPSVTPQPKKGKWIVISCEPTDIFKCSECGMRVINPYRYCHSCGTKMEVEDEIID